MYDHEVFMSLQKRESSSLYVTLLMLYFWVILDCVVIDSFYYKDVYAGYQFYDSFYNVNFLMSLQSTKLHEKAVNFEGKILSSLWLPILYFVWMSPWENKQRQTKQ